MKLIIGLGNPGKEYERTRHNAGFMFADKLREDFDFPKWSIQKKFDALVSESIHNGEKIVLAKPQTFMNASGASVARLYAWHKCKPENLLLVFDDVDLAFSAVRFRTKGSAGTHNGMKSVIAALGFNNFPRLRIGIESRGVHAPKQQDTSSFVLDKFSKTELAALKDIFNQAFLLAFPTKSH